MPGNVKIATRVAGKSVSGIGAEVTADDGSPKESVNVLLVGTGICLTTGRDGMVEIEEETVIGNGNMIAITTDENGRSQLHRRARRNRRPI